MDASKVENKYTQEVDRFTLDRLDVCFCTRCREVVTPELPEDVCPFCSSAVSEYDSVIDAVCDSGLVSYLHRSS
jgi:Zn finger protein HypA/HybF involved in hydrogenase expression